MSSAFNAWSYVVASGAFSASKFGVPWYVNETRLGVSPACNSKNKKNPEQTNKRKLLCRVPSRGHCNKLVQFFGRNAKELSRVPQKNMDAVFHDHFEKRHCEPINFVCDAHSRIFSHRPRVLQREVCRESGQ